MLRQWRVKEPYPYAWLHKDYILFQQFLPNNLFDTRITIIGKRAFTSRRHVRRNDFRSSGSGNDDWNQDNIDPGCINLAFEVSKRLGFQCMSYDFLYDEHKQPLISEISYTSPDWTIWSCPGYWDEMMGWHGGHLWPQYCILSDVLKIPDLKQPEMAR
jgi:glutathione synthase/RimK-type ligase-like ATP-grasp enzyme